MAKFCEFVTYFRVKPVILCMPAGLLSEAT